MARSWKTCSSLRAWVISAWRVEGSLQVRHPLISTLALRFHARSVTFGSQYRGQFLDGGGVLSGGGVHLSRAT